MIRASCQGWNNSYKLLGLQARKRIIGRKGCGSWNYEGQWHKRQQILSTGIRSLGTTNDDEKKNHHHKKPSIPMDEEERQPRAYRRADSEMVIMENEEESDDPIRDFVESIKEAQVEAAKVAVPWFLENMPSAYFKQVEPELRDQHLAALIALYDLVAEPELTLKSADGKVLTMISGGKLSPKKLAHQLEKLPTSAPLTGMKVFNSLNGQISLNIFEFENTVDQEFGSGYVTAELEEYVTDLMNDKYENDPRHPKPAEHFEIDTLRKFIKERCSQNYVSKSSPRRLCKQIQLYHEITKRGEDEVGVDIEESWGGNENQVMITVAITNVVVMAAIRRIAKFCESRKLNIVRTHLDLLHGPLTENEVLEGVSSDPDELLKSNHVAMFRVLVEPEQEGELDMSEVAKEIESCLPSISKWLDDRSMNLILKYGMKSQEAELITGLCDLAHAILAPKDPFEFARSNIENVVADESRMPFTMDVVDLFLKRFDPNESHRERTDQAFFEERIESIRENVNNSGELKYAQEVYSCILDIIKGTLRTNSFLPNRFGLCFRLDPALCVQHLLDDRRQEVPYGVFFVHGRRFAGFQVRFRDIARGGLRIVTPRNKEMLGVESARQLQECYDLAFAQQLKNKDIAEGGSKAVCLVDTENFDVGVSREHVIRKSLKAMVNSVLDLITPGGKSRIVDHMDGKEEFIYFGPDEQVTPEHINWIVKRAAQRGYTMANAFMSSKPSAGFNHKEFGVTSEGVAVFLDEALRSTGVDTSQPFTIKISGGPDGDVAGNLLKILHRNYGENARVVGLADGSGCLEDPDGINWEELLRLFHEAKPIQDINKQKLGPSAQLHLADTPTGINMRNTMHNRVKADAFVPGGGRPATINDTNWEKFLLPDGTPSSPLIVEGANLFLTPFAREKLCEKGVVIVKDSSANKCGVICSSMEIISSMLLSEEEFLEIKPELVEDVLDGLRSRAQSEASLMFREYKANPSTPLPPVSERISRAINRSTDSFAKLLETFSKSEMEELLPVIKAHLPKTLMDKAWDRFPERVPEAYIRFQLSCILASELVYREGIAYASSIDEKMLGEWLLKYLQKSMSAEKIVEKLESNQDLTDEEQKVVREIVKRGGARTMVDHHL